MAPRRLSHDEAPREAMHYDVVIVGGGPSGLSAAIRLKQLAASSGKDLSVCVVEKGPEIGSHILSGNVFEPRALTELIPNWKELGAPIDTPVVDDVFLFLTKDKSYQLPQFLLPPMLHNDGNFIISLGKVVRWLGQQAGALGVDIFPGFAASEVLYGPEGGVAGIATRDMGIGKDGKPKSSFSRGIELRARQTIFSEGCRGSCSESVMKKFNLRANAQPQTYGIGIKEVWQVPERNFVSGMVQHTLGWPLQNSAFDLTFGGTFMYHMNPNLVLIGLVVGLDYANPYIHPYNEFQRWKHHPSISKFLEGGECISYGARALNEGGYHAIPKLTFPGGALIGDSAGFLNSVKVKGSHTAMKSGIVAAEAIHELLTSEGAGQSVLETGEVDATAPALEATAYQANIEKSWVYEELKVVRNSHASFHYGMLPGLMLTGASTWVFKGREPWTISNEKTDAEKTRPIAEFAPIEYPKPDGKLSFDLLTNLTRSGTNHDEQPSHLKIKPEKAHVPESVSLQVYGGPEQRFCPAKVYEYLEDASGKKSLVINAQNCVHCKTCSIKAPEEFIDWTVPEGGGGPAYEAM